MKNTPTQIQNSALFNEITLLDLIKVNIQEELESIKLDKFNKFNKTYLLSIQVLLEAMSNVEVEYEIMLRKNMVISECKTFDALPQNCQRYILQVQQLVGVSV